MEHTADKYRKGKLRRLPAEHKRDIWHLIVRLLALVICVMDIGTLIGTLLILMTGLQNGFAQFIGYLLFILIPINITLPLWNNDARDLKTIFNLMTLCATIVIPLFLLSASTDISVQSGISLVARILLICILAASGYIAYRIFRYIPTIADDIVRPKTFAPIRRIIEGYIQIICFLLVAMAALLIWGTYAFEKDWALEVISSAFPIFWSWLFLSASILFMHLGRPHMNKPLQIFCGFVGLLIFCAFTVPMVSTTLMSIETKPPEATASPATQRNYAFSPFDYLFGIETAPYILFENVPYLVGTEGVDADKLLSYDAYLPNTSIPKPENGYPVLVRIHGGSWSSGDKGAYNFSAMNKYFAGLGYAVFDIQYGLSATKKPELLESGDPIYGNFDIDDMVRHVGLFTIHLVEQAEKYQIDTDKVFLSGGSAGGQLALTAGLALESGRYSDMFGNLQIRGIIPFYPAVGLSPTVGIDGLDEFLDPTPFITADSPPVLIYQGDRDGTVSPAVAERFRSNYLASGNENCTLISLPYATHASDLYFSGYYNQTFLYVMERFMKEKTQIAGTTNQ